VSRDTAQTRTLHRAVNVCGGLSSLAETLGVSAETLATWLDGNGSPSVDIYIRALDVVAEGRQGRRLIRRSNR
jgi:DNA-binding phage protein